jgi:predicted ATPase/DNA-binding SARP family transcriptional activator
MGLPGEPAALRLEVLVSGGPRASLGGQPLAGFRTRKAQALFVYLALAGRPQPREHLAGLLWGGVPDSFARASLRQSLANLRHLLGVHLETTPAAAALRPEGVWIDAAALQALLGEASPGVAGEASDGIDLDRLRAATALYEGDFLAGFEVPDAPTFDEWVAVERERLRRLAVEGLRRLAAAHGARGEPDGAIAALRRALTLEPWHEEMHRQVMAVLAGAGRRSEALAQYAAYRRLLADELGVEPDTETTALYERLHAGEVESRGAEAPHSPHPAGLPEAPRAVSTPPAPRSVLPPPVPPTPLLGRAAEIGAVDRLLARPDVRLVTVVGPPGVGKTRLALEVAAHQSAKYAGGVAFVELAPLSDPALVLPAIAQALGVREDRARPLPDLLAAALRDRHLLLVLDNCEQVLLAAPALAALLASCPRLVVLATSRAPLRLRGEHELPLEPLALPDRAHLPDPSDPAALLRFPAVSLFVQRVVAVRPDFALTAANARAVAELCTRLDGLPLALELAAARTRLLPLEALVERLDSRLRLLAGGARDLPARQQALRSAVAWSYDLLDSAGRRLFRRLGVFAGGFTLEAAEAVGGGQPGAPAAHGAAGGGGGALPSLPGRGEAPPAAGCLPPTDVADVLEGLERLADASLLRRTGPAAGEPRFGMLETLREYALEQLEASGEAAEVRRRHAAFFVTLAERGWTELRGPRQAEWAARLDHDHDNVRAALDWALGAGGAALALRLAAAHATYWQFRSHLAEGRRWLAAALDLGRATDAAAEALPALPALRAQATFWAGWFAWFQGDLGEGGALLEAAAADLRVHGDDWWHGFALSHWSQVALAQGDLVQARERVEAAVALLRATREPWGLGITLTQLADVLSEEGDAAAALRLYDEGAALLRRAGDPTMLALPLTWSAQAAAVMGDRAGARTRYGAALSVARASGHGMFMAMALRGLGTLALLDGDHAPAAARFTEALALARDIGHLRGADVSLGGLAAVAAARGQPARAARLLGAADALRGPDVVLDVADRATLEGASRAARAVLGAAAYEQAYAAGLAMAAEQAIAFALAPQTPAPPATPAVAAIREQTC